MQCYIIVSYTFHYCIIRCHRWDSLLYWWYSVQVNVDALTDKLISVLSQASRPPALLSPSKSTTQYATFETYLLNHQTRLNIRTVLFSLRMSLGNCGRKPWADVITSIRHSALLCHLTSFQGWRQGAGGLSRVTGMMSKLWGGDVLDRALWFGHALRLRDSLDFTECNQLLLRLACLIHMAEFWMMPVIIVGSDIRAAPERPK